MTKLKALTGSRLFLLVASAITSGAMIAYIFPASAYIVERSVSVTDTNSVQFWTGSTGSTG